MGTRSMIGKFAEKLYHVTYYQWSFNRFGEKDFTYENHWCDASVLADLKADRWVSELTVHEEKA